MGWPRTVKAKAQPSEFWFSLNEGKRINRRSEKEDIVRRKGHRGEVSI